MDQVKTISAVIQKKQFSHIDYGDIFFFVPVTAYCWLIATLWQSNIIEINVSCWAILLDW